MTKVIIDVTKAKTVFSPKELLAMPRFQSFIDEFFSDARKERPNSGFLSAFDSQSLIAFFLGLVEKSDKALTLVKGLSESKKDDLLNLVDALYDYWRKHERYVVFVKTDGNAISHREFVRRFTELSQSIVIAYRDIYETIFGHEQAVYRIIPSGGNAGVLLNQETVPLPSSLAFLEKVPMMETVVTQPPFIIKTRQNTRKGFFFEQNLKVGPENFDADNAYGVLVNIAGTKGLVFFDRDYMGFLVALGNLFQMESYDPKKSYKFDYVVLFGTSDTGDKSYYYREDGMYVGVCPKAGNVDYFGYAKKMLLTLFNLVMIDRKLLPIHGAGFRIRIGETTTNLVLLGDSGAGKSETLETVKRMFGDQYQIDTIFDDMGTFHLIDGKVYATGTEIGAFVRLNDLDAGYSLRSADRAVFMNIDQDNSRVIIPVEDYEMTYTLHPVEIFLLADNYHDTKEGISFYRDSNVAMADFIKGERMAMKTTHEKGLVSTFFANPFGPYQRKDDVMAYLPDYFKALFDHKVPVGRLFTRLSIDHQNGPEFGANALIDLLKSVAKK